MANQYFLRESWSLKTHTVLADSISDLLDLAPSLLGIPHASLHYTLSSSTLTASLRLAGGKGGFGSLLRSMNPKKTLADNYDSCRDLSGRRLRTVQMEQRMDDWQARQQEEEKYVSEEVKQYEEQKRGLKKEMRENQYRVDDRYIKEVKTGASEVERGVSEGIKVVKAGGPEKRRPPAGFTLESLLEEDGEFVPPKKR